MLQQGFNPDNSDYDGRTALMLAASKGHGEVVELLLTAGMGERREGGKKGLRGVLKTEAGGGVELPLTGERGKWAKGVKWGLNVWGEREVVEVLLTAGIGGRGDCGPKKGSRGMKCPSGGLFQGGERWPLGIGHHWGQRR